MPEPKNRPNSILYVLGARLTQKVSVPIKTILICRQGRVVEFHYAMAGRPTWAIRFPQIDADLKANLIRTHTKLDLSVNLKNEFTFLFSLTTYSSIHLAVGPNERRTPHNVVIRTILKGILTFAVFPEKTVSSG